MEDMQEAVLEYVVDEYVEEDTLIRNTKVLALYLARALGEAGS